MKIAIVEENQIVRQGMSHIVQMIVVHADLVSVASLTDWQLAYPGVQPDIVLKVVRKSEQVDQVVTMFVHKIRALFPGVFVILLSGDMRKSTIQKYLANGVKGYLDKAADVNELQDCIEKVAKGDTYLNVEIIFNLLREKGGQGKGNLQSRKTTEA